MSFYWQTEKQRNKQIKDEEFALKAIAGFHKTMADILREQMDMRRLEPRTAGLSDQSCEPTP